MGSVSVTRQREKKFISRFELLFKPKFNNAETKNSALSIPRTFSYALDTFLEKTSCLFLSHLAVRNEFTELLFSTCARYCWNYCHFIFCRSSATTTKFSYFFSNRFSQKCTIQMQTKGNYHESRSS